MIWLAYFTLGFLVLRLLVALTNLLTRQWLHPDQPEDNALVSVLIPARNEERNIGKLLESLGRQDYPQLEILIYDDLSTDQTARLVEECAKKDSRIRLLPGKGLPQGWLGKNHACHQLAREAKGDYLLFIDADVTAESKLISQALAHLQKHKLSLLSIFPQQMMHTLGERLTVPLMNWILVSLLPLIFTRISSWTSFSAANGQFMLFHAKTYRKHHFHQMVRSQKVEDIIIFRKLKKLGLRGHTILSNGQVKCRMYTSFREALQGFSKNVFEFFGNSILLTVFMALLTTFGFVPVYLALGTEFALAWLAGAILLRAMAAFASRQNVVQTIVLLPFQQLAFFVVIIEAIRVRIRGKSSWKGRKV
ncbi:MAG: glycosyltransferase [Bacteroides sp.]|jgi:glycosyltransferase involved in cell wall biosynthesis|nr:glycosyltransferase [Bacteroides sp.]